MARTAPDAFVKVEDAALHPLEPILSGASGDAEWQAILRNVNHAHRFLVPMVVRQDEVSGSTSTINSSSTSITLIQVWRIPLLNCATGQTLGGDIWGYLGAAGAGVVAV